MVRRFFCDFCHRRGMAHAEDMRIHEWGCTMNPNRKCWLCEDAYAPDIKKVSAELRKMIDPDAGLEESLAAREDAIKWLRTQCGDCPACMLSVLRQAKVFAWDVFDYKKEREAWDVEKNRELAAICGF